MRKKQFALSPVALICFSIYILTCPALAAEAANSDPGTAASTNEVMSKNESAVQANTPSPSVIRKSTLPKKIYSIATAFVIGTPICVVRRTKYEEWYGVHGMIGDSESKGKKFLAGAFWFPFAIVTGTAEAPFDAITNGLMYPAFSKDQLSQGKLTQNN